MSLPVVLSPEAEREFDVAADWYEQQAGSGAKFVARVRETRNQIGLMPEFHAVVHRNVRRAVVRRFPYNLYYRVQADRGEVIAVMPNRRDPSECQVRA